MNPQIIISGYFSPFGLGVDLTYMIFWIRTMKENEMVVTKGQKGPFLNSFLVFVDKKSIQKDK